MDQRTYNAHQHLVGAGEPISVVPLPHLTDEEYDLLAMVKRNNHRIEQERMQKTLDGLD